MELKVYKGFDAEFLSQIEDTPLVDNNDELKRNVLLFDKKVRKQLDLALLGLEDDDSAWITYEEYTLIKTRIDEAASNYGLKIIFYRNNIYPDYYPIPFELSDDLVREINKAINTDSTVDTSEECQRFLAVYNTLVEADGVYFGGFYNYEYESEEKNPVKDYYPTLIKIEDSQDVGKYNVFLNEDIDTYLRDLSQIMKIKPSIIGLKSTDGLVSKRISRKINPVGSKLSYCFFFS